MLKLRGPPQLLAHRPQWRLRLQRTTCLQHEQQHQQPWQQRRCGAQLTAQRLRADNELALQLRETGLWTNGRWVDQLGKVPKTNKRQPAIPKSKRKIAPGDKNRVNIVSEPLVNDIIAYMGPKFVDRHKGCDIIDIYPGAGLWSSKLNEALQPRSHILMEPDAQLYEPFLKDLKERPGVKLVPLSGIIWRNLTSILSKEHLPHQVEIDPLPDAVEGAEAAAAAAAQDDKTSRQPASDSVLPRNDTLLVTANLAFFPRRRFGQFESVSQLVLFQFISSIRASSLFQKYGLVRMLVWVEDDDRHALVARSCQRRRRLALDGEMATDWVSEIAGRDGNKITWFMRDHSLDLESCRRVLAKMRAEGIEIPKGRETKLVQEARQQIADGVDFNSKTIGPKMTRPYLAELEELESRFSEALAERAESIRLKKEMEAEVLKKRQADRKAGILVENRGRKKKPKAEAPEVQADSAVDSLARKRGRPKEATAEAPAAQAEAKEKANEEEAREEEAREEEAREEEAREEEAREEEAREEEAREEKEPEKDAKKREKEEKAAAKKAAAAKAKEEKARAKEEKKREKEEKKRAKEEEKARVREEKARAKAEKARAKEEKARDKKNKAKKAEDDVGKDVVGGEKAEEAKTGEDATDGEKAEAKEAKGIPRKAAVEAAKAFDTRNEDYLRFKQLQFRRNREQRVWTLIDDLIKERDDMAQEHSRATTAEAKAKLRAREEAWNAKISEMNSKDQAEFLLYRDNLHIFRQAARSAVQTKLRYGKITATGPFARLQATSNEPLSAHAHNSTDARSDACLPIMSWDRRDREPLTVSDEEFFPNAECALIDIQPKSMHPLLRAMGPGTSRAGDHFELIVRAMMAMGAEPVSKAIETVWPGSAQGVLQKCPSLYDVEQGGCPVGGTYGELSARSINEKQWTEILEAWMAWPFRPTLGQLIQRISEEGYNTEGETMSSD